MKASDLKKWMRENEVTELDIAAFLKIHPMTITRYLNGDNTPRRSTLDGYKRFIAWFENNSKQLPSIKATGS